MKIFIIMVLLNVARIKNEYDMDEGETWTGAWSILWNGFPMRERIARLGKHLPRTWFKPAMSNVSNQYLQTSRPCQLFSNQYLQTSLPCQMFHICEQLGHVKCFLNNIGKHLSLVKCFQTDIDEHPRHVNLFTISIGKHLDGWPQWIYKVVVERDCWDCRQNSKEAKILRLGFGGQKTYSFVWSRHCVIFFVSQMDKWVQCMESNLLW